MACYNVAMPYTSSEAPLMAEKAKTKVDIGREESEQGMTKLVRFRVTPFENDLLAKMAEADFMPNVGAELRKLIRLEAERRGLVSNASTSLR